MPASTPGLRPGSRISKQIIVETKKGGRLELTAGQVNVTTTVSTEGRATRLMMNFRGSDGSVILDLLFKTRLTICNGRDGVSSTLRLQIEPTKRNLTIVQHNISSSPHVEGALLGVVEILKTEIKRITLIISGVSRRPELDFDHLSHPSELDKNIQNWDDHSLVGQRACHQ